MTPIQFAILSICVNVVLSVAIHFHNYRNGLTIPMVCAAVVLPLIPVTGIYFFSLGLDRLLFNVLLILLALGVSLLIDISSRFMRKDVDVIKFKRIKVSSRFIIYFLGVIGIVTSFLTSWKMQLVSQNEVHFNFGTPELLFMVLLICQSIYGLYIIEMTYRFALEYQRRVGRLCFLALIVFFVFMIVFLGKILLYGTLHIAWLHTALSIFGISYPVLLLGFLRYRLSFEHVSVHRNTVYTSIALMLSGAAFFGIGVLAYLFKFFQFDMQYFEWSLVLVGLALIVIIFVNSGNVRRLIIDFVNNRFYRSKYDYREQFFLLYKTYVSGTNQQESLTCMVENMKYAVAVVDAFVFLRNTSNNTFVMHRNPEFATSERIVITGNEFPESFFKKDSEPLDLVFNENGKREKILLAAPFPAIKTLAPSVIFPILHEDSLQGLLMIKLGDGRKLDNEDVALIDVFTRSIGAVIYRNTLAKEKIEHEQFQSFHQVVSFVIHDIKNQTATLSLLAKNANQYIGNQDFQKNLVRSISNCSNNLTAIVDKLTKQRNVLSLKLSTCEVVPVIENSLHTCSIEMFPEVTVKWDLRESCSAKIDSLAMNNVIVNLVKNAVEAMQSKGLLRLSVGQGLSITDKSLELFGLTQNDIKSDNVLIIIEDSGQGMSQEFLENGLFKPFTTTKDKGMGIGLYQSKLTIEKMGGRIYCFSKENHGTSFCIIL